MSYYIYGPTAHDNFINRDLQFCIRLIGEQQTGKGSFDAKGRRFIKSETHCSNWAIKRLYRSRINLIVQKDNLGNYSFSFHSETTAIILNKIIFYINNSLAERQKNELVAHFNKSKINTRTIFDAQKTCLQYIDNVNYKNQGEKAEKILNEI